MSNRAWMPLHIADYLADTGHLSATEHGAYLLLIMHYWQKGNLPEDERLIARIAKLDSAQWDDSRAVLAMLFGPGWTHKRIDAELAKADDIIEKRRAAAKGRRGKDKPPASAEHLHSNSSDTGALPLTNNLSEANASDAAASDPRDELWTEGVSSLKAMTGKTETAARSLIGRWARDAKDDCALVLAKIRTAKVERIGEPVAWITAALAPKPEPPPKPRNAGELARQQLREMTNDPRAETRHLDQGDRNTGFAGTSIARRIAIASGG